MVGEVTRARSTFDSLLPCGRHFHHQHPSREKVERVLEHDTTSLRVLALEPSASHHEFLKTATDAAELGRPLSGGAPTELRAALVATERKIGSGALTKACVALQPRWFSLLRAPDLFFAPTRRAHDSVWNSTTAVPLVHPLSGCRLTSGRHKAILYT